MSKIVPDASTLSGWRKSSYSGSQGDCVEMTTAVAGAVAVRDSKIPTGPALLFDRAAMAGFVRAVKTGDVQI